MDDVNFKLNDIRIQFGEANCIKMVTNGNKNEFVPYTEHNGLYLACSNFKVHWQGVILDKEEIEFLA